MRIEPSRGDGHRRFRRRPFSARPAASCLGWVRTIQLRWRRGGDRVRNPRIRQKIAAALLALVALWGFAAYVTVGQGLDLLDVQTIDHDAGRPTVALVTALQEERRTSMVALGDPGDGQARSDLAAARTASDRAETSFLTHARSGLKDIGRSDVKRRIREMIGLLNGLAPARRAIDAGALGRQPAADAYDSIIDGAFRIYSYDADLDDRSIARTGRTLIALSRAKEILSREDAVLAGAIAAGHFSAGEHLRFAELSGTYHFLAADAAADLPDADRERYDALTSSPVFTRFRAVEDRVERFTPRPRADRPPVTATDWSQSVAPVQNSLENLVLTAGNEVVARARPGAIWEVLQLVLAGGLGLVAVITAIIVAITTTRDLMRQLEKLRSAARELAERRLPGVVERLGRGETVDVAAEAPPLSFGTDEIGQVGHAFNSVQETAIRTAVEQAELRRGIRDVLLSLARRSQALVHRQLTLLDEMEREKDDAKDLEELFRVDHLATRMRRNAENLIILSGATPARGWRRPVPVIDVVRSAVAEVENYTRVDVSPRIGDVALAGRAVGDIVHLLAELIENGVSFSPPDTTVEVTGRRVAHGYAIEIEDRGLGMTDEILATVNERIADPPEFNLAGSAHLGLYVVGRLAERYDLRVALKHSTYGGTTAVVLIPHGLIEDAAPAETAPSRRGPERPAGAVAASAGPSHGSRGAVRTATAVVLDEPAEHARAAVRESPPSGVTPHGYPARVSARRRAETGPAAPEPRTPEPARAPAAGPEDDAAGSAGRPAPGAGSATRTPGGLPIRVPDANLADPLRDAQAGPADPSGPAEARPADAADADRDRSPEQVRKAVGGLQAATRRARDAAARGDTGPHPLHGARPDPDEPSR